MTLRREQPISKHLQRTFLLILAGLWLLTGNVSATEKLTDRIDLSYQPEAPALSFLQHVDQPTVIVLLYGAWCKDSQREVPRFMRILELAKNPNLELIEYEVDREKIDTLGKVVEYDVKFVPTFIILRDDHELGRIIEHPKISLEVDLVEVLSKASSFSFSGKTD